jgi:HAMP domain-containing protein
MGLKLKFNLVLLTVFLLGFAVSGFLSHRFLHKNAREEIVRNAELMMETAQAVRSYTVSDVRPQLQKVASEEFIPQAAPASMLKTYGSSGGFGWQMTETVGAQIVTVPMSLPVKNANRAFNTFMISLAGIFVFVFLVLNIMLSRLIIRPIAVISAQADAISKGNIDMPEFVLASQDEVGSLAASFNWMRRSLEQAMKLARRQ